MILKKNLDVHKTSKTLKSISPFQKMIKKKTMTKRILVVTKFFFGLSPKFHLSSFY